MSKRQYEFLYPLAKTPIADVYRCQEYAHGRVVREVAIKILRESWTEQQESITWLRQELSLLQALHHPVIPKVYELTTIKSRVAIVIEWIDGMDLRSLVQGMRAMKQRIPLKVTLSLIADIAESLDVIYNQAPISGTAPLRILHGNLKPNNIMIGAKGKLSLLDFGMTPSDLGGRESATREMQYDAVEYMAPERRFFEPQGPASDIYSLSVILFEMLAGKPLGKSPPSEEQHNLKVEKYCHHLLRPMPLGLEVKEELANLLMSGMAYDSAKRPLAHEMANRARRMADSISGVTVEQWAGKAIGFFQARQEREHLEGTLQGAMVSEDTQVFERQKSPVDDEDVDTSIMRRGAVADFVEASLDLSPEQIVEMTEREPTASISFESTAIGEPKLEKGGRAVSLPQPEMDAPIASVVPTAPRPPVPMVDTRFDGNTVPSISVSQPVASMEIVDMDGVTQTVTTVDVRPQAMPRSNMEDLEEEGLGIGGMSTRTLVMLFLGGAAILMVGIISAVVYLDSEDAVGEQDVVPTVAATSSSPASSNWEGVRFQSSIESKSMKVKCGDTQERGTEIVTMPDVEGASCFVEVRTPDRQVFRTTIEPVKAGLYTCFAEHTDTCQWSVKP